MQVTAFDSMFSQIDRAINVHLADCEATTAGENCPVVSALSAVQAQLCELALVWLDKSQAARRN